MTCWRSLLLFGVLALSAASPPHAEEANVSASTRDSRAKLKEYVAELQQRPDDQDLRKRILTLANGLRPKPAVPDDAEVLAGKALYRFQNAKSEADFGEAADAYARAILTAPWVVDNYFNLSVAQERAGRPAEAMASLRLYIHGDPNTKDRKAALARMGALEAAAEDSVRRESQELAQRAQQGQAELRREEESNWLRSLNGSRYVNVNRGPDTTATNTLDIVGDELIAGSIWEGENSRPWEERGRTRLTGREFVLRLSERITNSWCWPTCPSGCTASEDLIEMGGAKCPEHGRISADGSSITLQSPNKPHQTHTTVYQRQ